VLQCKTGQYNTVEYRKIQYSNTSHTITHITQNDIQHPVHAKLPKEKIKNT